MDNTIAIIITEIIIIGIIVGTTSIIVKLIKRKNKNANNNIPMKPKYKRKMLLTGNEYAFYKRLKEFAEKNNLHILSKIRMADIVEPIQTGSQSEWYSSFGKIKSKHVDFALAKKENLYILCLIELDDNSHKSKERKERDEFIDSVYEEAKIPIIHTNYYNEETENQLMKCIGLFSPSICESQE